MLFLFSFSFSGLRVLRYRTSPSDDAPLCFCEDEATEINV